MTIFSGLAAAAICANAVIVCLRYLFSNIDFMQDE